VNLSKPKKVHSSIEVKEKTATAYVGPPIVVSSVGELQDERHIDKVYKTIKHWLVGEIGQMGFKVLKKARIARWDTWTEPDYFGTVSHGGTENLKRDMRIVEPYLSYLSNHVTYSKFPNRSKIAEAFKTLKQWFKDNNVNNDIAPI
jgi:hypothetical protein